MTTTKKIKDLKTSKVIGGGIIDNCDKKKSTITKIMTLRDYITLGWHFENPGKDPIDLSDYNQAELARQSKHSMRLTRFQKEYFDEYFDRFVVSGGIDTILSKMKKVDKPISLSRPAASVAVSPARQVVSPAIDIEQEVQEPVSKIEKDHPWIIDPSAKIEPCNVDLDIIISMAESGQISVNDFKLEPGDIFNLLSANHNEFEHSSEMKPKYICAGNLLEILNEGAKTFDRYNEIMNEEEPSEEEQLSRYAKYVFNFNAMASNPHLDKDINIISEVSSVSESNIVTDANTYFYGDDADGLVQDVLYLASLYKISCDMPINIAGKSTNVNRIIKKLYAKYPLGLPGKCKFYHTRKEAYEDGYIKI